MSYEVCNTINTIDNFFWMKRKGAVEVIQHYEFINTYCPFNNDLGKNVCYSYGEMISSAVLFFLKWLENNYHYEDDLKNDKLAEYAILWLSYKLSQDPQDEINTLKDLYTQHIEKNTYYNQNITNASNNKTYKDIINKKQDLMNIGINDISQFYDAFKSLCSMYNELGDDTSKCEKCSQKANEFVNKYNELNEDPNITGNNSYKKILTTLFDDYGNLKKKCEDDPSSNFPTLSPIKTTQSFEDASSGSSIERIESPEEGSEKLSAHTTALNPEATPSSSSIASKLIPALLI
ncbi:CIR protein, partial [Plasmodium chabaudi adami]